MRTRCWSADLADSVRLDRWWVAFQALPRAWLAVGVLGLAPAFVVGGSPTLLAVSLGGVVLAYQAFRNLAEGLDRLIAVRVAWERTRLLTSAAGQGGPLGHPRFAARAPSRGQGRGPVLEGCGVTFRHPGRGVPVLQDVSVRIAPGDRVLLEGPSGGGKSTLAAVLSGGRPAQTGLLLLGGLDPSTLGIEGWRKRMALAPQFHDNHVLLGTLAFNLLLGRSWPPGPEDLTEAERICRGLGLGPLLERMPSGLAEMVGEMGWRLSHGERGRLFVARACSNVPTWWFSTKALPLDPETLRQTLTFVLANAPAVLVIAHP